MTVSSAQAARHYEDNQRKALEVIGWYTDLADKVEGQIAEVDALIPAAALTLARAYLPDLSESALEKLSALTGFQGLKRRDPRAAMARETGMLAKRIARITADERYTRREYLVGTHGHLTLALAEAKSMLDPWEAECLTYELQDGFLELVQAGYDTPAFAENVGWLEPRYWRMWAAGDRITEALGKDDFGDDVLPEWFRVSGERDKWRGQVAEASKKVLAVHELVREHDTAVARMPRLGDIYLESSVQMVGEFLQSADLPLLEEWLIGDGPFARGIKMALRRLAGLRAKKDILTELVVKGISPLVQETRARAAKYNRKVTKFRRSKHARTKWNESQLDLKFATKMDKHRMRCSKTSALVDRVVLYDDYDDFRLDNPPELWWVAMTGKRPTRLTPHLRSWHERHPEHELLWDHREEHGQAVARAAAARGLDEVGYLS